jgi:hypothetical protein
MTAADIQSVLVGALIGLGATTAFVVVLWVGFCVVFGFPKLRPGGRNTPTVRSLDEMMGGKATFLPPDAPRGRVDQLHAPELFHAGRPAK